MIKNIELLLEKNNNIGFKPRLSICNGVAEYCIEDHYITIGSVNRIMTAVHRYFQKYPRVAPPFILKFQHPEVMVVDKLTWTLLESVCYYVIAVHKRRLYITGSFKRIISSEGLFNSPLLTLNAQCWDVSAFTRSFESNIARRHYRKVIRESAAETACLGNITGDIYSFLNNNSIQEAFSDQISEVVSELAGNACEHAKTDCIVDLDITNDYENKNKETCIGINISVTNYAEQLFEAGLEHKILNEKVDIGRYRQVKDAFDCHKSSFSKEYTKTDFFRVAAFQTGISGRSSRNCAGGMGLVKLVTSLEKQADYHHCYMISGSRTMRFIPEYHEYSDGWIGFNQSNDYLHHIPDIEIFSNADIFMPGTAFNLNFAFRKDVAV